MPLDKHVAKVCAYVPEKTHATVKELADRREVTVSKLLGSLITRELARARKAGEI